MWRAIRRLGLEIRRSGFPTFSRFLGAHSGFHRSLLFGCRAHALNFYTSDSAAVHFDDGESKLPIFKPFAAARNETELIQNESANGRISGVFRQRDVVLRIQITDVQGCVKNYGT